MKTESEELAYYKALAERYETALREILDGSKVTGRWIDDETSECPNDDDHQNPDVDHPGCTWLAYDEDEQRNWLECVSYIAETVLKETD